MADRLDIVCPVYNDEQTLPQVVDAVAAALDPGGYQWRLILVCDGSPDDSWRVMCELAQQRGNILAVELSRNFGQHIAISAGLDHADAEYVAVMDSDLQDPPEAIAQMLEKLRAEDLDIVYACRLSRKDPPMKRLTSWLFWKLIRVLAGPQIVPNQLMLRVMNRRYVRAFKTLRERHRFIGGLSAWLGFRQGCIELEGGESVRGRSNYNLRRLLRVAMDATTSMSVVPLRFATGLGFTVTLIALAYAAYVFARKLLFDDLMTGFAATATLISFFAGVQLLMLGIVGEYLGRVLEEVQRRPLYLVREAVGAGAPDSAGTDGEPA